MNNETDDYHYFGAKIVYKGSDIQGDIYVLDYDNGHRVMCFESIYEQSRMNKRYPDVPIHEYIQAMLLVLAFCQPRSALILGLGAGSLLRALHRINPGMMLEGVDNRALVITVADKYFGLPASDNIKLAISDADQYVSQRARELTDLVFVDLYESYDMPPVQNQLPFVQDCYDSLSEAGWLVFNFHKMPNANSAFILFLKKHCKTLLVCSVKEGNYVLFASKQALPNTLMFYANNIKDIEKSLDVSLLPLYKRLEFLREKHAFLRKSVRKKINMIHKD